MKKPDPKAELKEAILDVAPELAALPGFAIVFPEQRIYRWSVVSRIRNNLARRALMLLTLPFMMLLNAWLLLWPCLWRAVLFPLAFLCWWWQLNKGAYQSMLDRWHVPYTEDQDAT